MLIIFDLDDTLIDTSGCITPYVLQKAFKVLTQEKGSESDFQELLRINQNVLKSPDALKEFAEKKQIDKEFLEPAVRELTSSLPESFSIACTPEAKNILYHYAKLYPIALVTGGKSSFQREKLKKAGIEASLFSKIGIPEDSVKKPLYKAFADELKIPPEKVWVCGDRIWMDLLPAHELGFNTVHMRWGRGRQMAIEPWVSHSISTLTELRNIIV